MITTLSTALLQAEDLAGAWALTPWAKDARWAPKHRPVAVSRRAILPLEALIPEGYIPSKLTGLNSRPFLSPPPINPGRGAGVWQFDCVSDVFGHLPIAVRDASVDDQCSQEAARCVCRLKLRVVTVGKRKSLISISGAMP